MRILIFYVFLLFTYTATANENNILDHVFSRIENYTNEQSQDDIDNTTQTSDTIVKPTITPNNEETNSSNIEEMSKQIRDKLSTNQALSKAKVQNILNNTDVKIKNVTNDTPRSDHPSREFKIDGFKAKRKNYKWGKKEPGYKYADFEFVFDALNPDHAKLMMDQISKMSKKGWLIDLNRSDQEYGGKGHPAVTVTQIRFKKRK